MSAASRQPSAEPRIQIATVEIRVLKIGSKQMTQAVFNQLEESDLIDPNSGELTGNAWGWVNYKCDRKRRQYVFERDTKLYRSLVSESAAIPFHEHYGEYREHSPMLNRLVQLGRSAHRVLATAALANGDITTMPEWSELAVFKAGDYAFHADTPEGNYWSDPKYTSVPKSEADWQRVSIPSALTNIYKEMKLEKMSAETTKLLADWLLAIRSRVPSVPAHSPEAVAKMITALLDTWEKSYSSLQEVDQLFIAV